LDNKKLGAILKEARKTKKLTLRDLEKETGITYSYISSLERSVYMPSPKKIMILANALGLDENTLLLMAGYAPKIDLSTLTLDEDVLSLAKELQSLEGDKRVLVRDFIKQLK
jgi:transcriptional regulator with XRE-family HTH domain